ncbi:MAG: zinc-binding alcohol dehydrogenase [Planctomycetes bacterium]|nr:zinc-binding alcohol dehydrogenase [Planctomycetota bacterium]
MKGRRIAVVAQRNAVVEEFDVPTVLDRDEVLLRVHYSLISPGTELGGYNAAHRKAPSNPGYTAVGQVAEVGEKQAPSLKGRIAYVFPAIDDSSHCHATHKVVKPGGLVLPIPEGLDPKAACFARIVNIALTPYRNAEPKLTGSVLVIGLGLVGNMIGQVGRILGFRTLGMDLDAARRSRAEEAGFDVVIDPQAGDPVQAVKQATDGQGANLTVNATGHAAAFMLSLQAAAAGGEVSTLGGARHGATAELQQVIKEIHTRHLTVRGGWEMLLPVTTSPASKVASTEVNLRDAFRWLANGSVRLDPIWTHTVKPEEFKGAYDALNNLDKGYLGVVVDWTGE